MWRRDCDSCIVAELVGRSVMANWVTEFQEWYSDQHPLVKAAVVVGGTAAACVGGVVAAPVVGAVASAAGLGAAGGTLAGAAASSAGLAALGGGSLAAGGMGMAGGTAVVATTAGALGAGATTVLSGQVDLNGKKSKENLRRAKAEEVQGDDIRFEDEA